MIGDVVGGAAFMICHGHETWHPDPEFFYKRGGGPMFDMGPYYLTTMINLMGGIDRVVSASRTTFPTRTITSQPLAGTIVDVDVSTYIAGTVKYTSGAIGTMSLSRRAVKEGSRCLIVDDFLKGGGTAKGMVDLMHEFGVEVVGQTFVMSTAKPLKKRITGEKFIQGKGVLTHKQACAAKCDQ